MTLELTVEAEPREDFGKNASRRLRRAGRLPAVVYGSGGPTVPVTVDPQKIGAILHSASGQNAIFTLEIKGKAPTRAMIRDWQAEPVHGGLLHVDFVRIARDTRLKVNVPVHVSGEAKGVKVQGGVFEFVLREVEVECLPEDLPETLTVDVTELTIGKQLRVSDLPASPKIKILTDPHRVVAHVVALKAEEEKPVVEAVEAAATAEPEVIRKGKGEEEGPEEAAAEAKSEAKKEGKKEK